MDLEINMIRDEEYIKNYGLKYEDDKAELAIKKVENKLTLLMEALIKSMDVANYP